MIKKIERLRVYRDRPYPDKQQIMTIKDDCYFMCVDQKSVYWDNLALCWTNTQIWLMVLLMSLLRSLIWSNLTSAWRSPSMYPTSSIHRAVPVDGNTLTNSLRCSWHSSTIPPYSGTMALELSPQMQTSEVWHTSSMGVLQHRQWMRRRGGWFIIIFCSSIEDLIPKTCS